MLRREQSRLPGKRKETMLNRNMRNTAILLVVFLAVYMFGNYFAEKNLMSGSGSSSYSYERLESDIAKNKVKSIEVVQNAQVPTGSAIVKLNDGEKKVAHVTDVNKVIDLAQQYKVSGDYFIMDKEGRRKSLGRYFIDTKIPASDRDGQLLLADGSHIMWIIGGRISEFYKVSSETKRVLRVSVQEKEEN